MTKHNKPEADHDFIGTWYIHEMDLWEEDYFNMEVQAYVWKSAISDTLRAGIPKEMLMRSSIRSLTVSIGFLLKKRESVFRGYYPAQRTKGKRSPLGRNISRRT